MTVLRMMRCLCAICACAALSSAAVAREPAKEFVSALRKAGYHDMAAEYLERIVKSPYVDDEFRDRYGYDLGTVLIDEGNSAGDPLVRDQFWEQGLRQLREFVASKPDHPLAAAANSKIGDTLLDRGRALLARSERGRDKDKLRQQAREMFAAAAKVLQAVEKQRVAQFEEQSKDVDREQRNKLGEPILEARLQLAHALCEMAKTYEAGSAEAKQALEQGIKQYKDLWDKYHNDGFAAAYVARVHEAKNYLELDKPDEALSRLNDVLALDIANQGLRDLVMTPGYLVALKAWHKKGDLKTAIERSEAYVASPSAAEIKRPEWLEMQYLLALAYQQHAETLKPGDASRTKRETEARKLAGEVVKHRSAVQNDARMLLGKLGRAVDEGQAGAKTFAEAFENATAAIQQYTGAKMAGEKAAEEGSAPAEVVEQQAAARDAAFLAARQTLSLADEKADLVKLNTARFYLCYLHWEYGQAETAAKKSASHYFDAAVLGDFLARRFPEHPNARQAMAIALASFQRIRQDVAQEVQQAAATSGKNGDELRAEVDAAVNPWSDKISELAQYAIAKWPNTDEAASAVAVLSSIAVERQEYDKAIEFAKKLKEGSLQRTDAELRIGRAMWSNYTRAKKAIDAEAKIRAENGGQSQNTAPAPAADIAVRNGNADSTRPQTADSVNEQTLAQWAKTAQALLESALSNAKSTGEIDRGVVLGLWALVQSYVSTSQPEKAIPWLEDEKLGLLPLVNNKHDAAEIEGLMFDAYRLALRAYIAVKPQQIDKALATMDALEKITGNDAKGREMLTTVYIAMGRDLQQEIKQLVAAGNSSEVAALSTAFEAFLKRLVGRESGNTFNSLFWVADTYSELGAGLAQTAGKSTDDRKRSEDYYRRAVTAFEKILERDKDDANFLPPPYLPLVQMRLAKAYRGAGEHNKALTLLVHVLKDKPNVLDVQFDAAYTYQEYAETDRAKRGKNFRYAITGGQKGDYRNVWGWNTLAEKVRAHEQRLRREADDPAKLEQAEQYRVRYQEARYNSVYCAFALATLETNSAEKERLLKVAKQGIWSAYAIVDTQFGGGEWKAKNERLLKDVQSALGESPIGLKEFEQKKQQQAQTATTVR